MITITLSVFPADENGSDEVLSLMSEVVQPLASKGISFSLNINTFSEDEEGQPEEPGE